VGKLHADAQRSAHYYRLTTANGTSVAISARHHLLANGALMAPEKLAVGDMLSTESGPQRLAHVTRVTEAGIYHIITPSGTYYVDGVACTTWVAYIPHFAWRIFADGYAHLRYLLGVPLVPDGEGALPLFKQYEIMEVLRAPEPLLFAIWPLTLLITMACEAINALVASPSLCGMSFVALLTIRSTSRHAKGKRVA